jgi:antitoxin component of MazEF toxin-antitoxin module
VSDTYQAKIERDGDDMVIVIPPPILDALGIKDGDQLRWTVEVFGGSLVLTRVEADASVPI